MKALLALTIVVGMAGCGDERERRIGRSRQPRADKPGGAPTGPTRNKPPVPAATASAAPTPTATPLVGSAITAYPESPEGLGNLASDLLASAHAGDEKTLIRLLDSLKLRDPETWFRDTFGRALGQELWAEYRPLHDNIGQLAGVLSGLAAGGQTKLTIERYDKADLPDSVGYQSAALAKMDRPTPLYSVRFGSPDGKKLFHLWSFVFQDGTFRYVGKMRKIIETPAATAPGAIDTLELRLREAEKARGG